MLRKRSAWAALFLSLTLVLSACGSSSGGGNSGTGSNNSGSSGGGTQSGSNNTPSTPTPSGPKIVTIGMWSAPDSLLPITNKTTYGTNVTELMYPNLAVMKPDLTYEGRLAEKWDISPNQDKFTFYLNKNAKWSDGKPITAHDVEYTFAVIAHPDTPNSRRTLITTLKGISASGENEAGAVFTVEGVKVINDHTVEFINKGPVDIDAFMEKVIQGIAIQPKHVLETHKDLKTFDQAPFVMKPQVTGGPFNFVEYVTDSHVELVANKDYWLGAPKLDKVFIKVIPATGAAAAIQKGEIHFSTGAGTGEVPIVDWDTVSKLATVTPNRYTGPSYQYLDINTSKPEFSDPRVRQAISMAINKDLIVQRLLRGEGEVMGTPINSTSKYHRPDLVKAAGYNPEEAKKLLTAAGWNFDRTLEILTPTGNKVREDSADIIQQNLQAIGMKVTITKVDFTTRQARSKAGDFDVSLVGFGAPFDPDFSPQVQTGAPFNDRGYSNAQLDDLFQKGILTANFDERKKIYDQIQEIFVKELPLIPLYNPKVLTVVNNNLVNVNYGPNRFSWNAHLWDLK